MNDPTWVIILLIMCIFQAIVFNYFFSAMLGKKDITERFFYMIFIIFYGTRLLINIMNVPSLNIIVVTMTNLGIALFIYRGTIPKKVFYLLVWIICSMVAENITYYLINGLLNPSTVNGINELSSKSIMTFISQLILLIIIKVFVNKNSSDRPAFSLKQVWAYLILPISCIIFLHATFEVMIKYELSVTDNFSLFVSCSGIVFANLAVFYNFEKYIIAQEKVQELSLINQKVEADKQYYEILDIKYKKNQQVIHDINNHLACIKGLVHSKDLESIDKYVQEIHQGVKDLTYEKITGNKVFDIVINEKKIIMEEKEINFEVNNYSIDLKRINDIDICTIVGNILDNAIESAEKCYEKLIDLDLYMVNDYYCAIRVINNCEVAPMVSDDNLVTTKKDKENHGIGTKNIKQALKKYQGHVQFSYDEVERMFTTLVLIPKDEIE